MLHLGEELPITSPEFLTTCQLHLSPEQVDILRATTPEPNGEPATEVEREWLAWETYFRNAIAAERASKSGNRTEEWLRHETDVFPGVRKQLSDAFSAANPAERALAIDRLRWNKLDDIQSRHLFDFGALVLYRIRLQIAERWTRKDVGQAQQNLRELLDTVDEQAQQLRRTTDSSTTT